MRMIRLVSPCCLPILLLLLRCAPPAVSAADKIPIIYSTDLYQPHEDPDDHVDLATLFALDEFEILGSLSSTVRNRRRARA